MAAPNRNLVTAHHGIVVVQRPPHYLDPVSAVELAAWLVVMADAARTIQRGEAPDTIDADTFDAKALFLEALEEVQNA